VQLKKEKHDPVPVVQSSPAPPLSSTSVASTPITTSVSTLTSSSVQIPIPSVTLYLGVVVLFLFPRKIYLLYEFSFVLGVSIPYFLSGFLLGSATE
jgi:hypothetical protein